MRLALIEYFFLKSISLKHHALDKFEERRFIGFGRVLPDIAMAVSSPPVESVKVWESDQASISLAESLLGQLLMDNIR